jgi:hypothetical protein
LRRLIVPTPTIFSDIHHLVLEQTPHSTSNMDELLPKLLLFPPHPPPKHPLTDAQYDEGIKAQIDVVAKMPAKVR